MDFDGIAQEWAAAGDLSAPVILSSLLDYDAGQLTQLRASVARHANLTLAVDVIDGYSAFREAKRRLDDSKKAAADMAFHAKRLTETNLLSTGLARASAERASHAQTAASEALRRANSPREKIDAAVVLELADNAVRQAGDAATAANNLTLALEALVRATRPPRPPGMDSAGK